MKYLFIDDIRNPSDYINSKHGDYVVEARDYKEAIVALNNYKFDYIYFDHDLGGEKTGYDSGVVTPAYNVLKKYIKDHNDIKKYKYNEILI